MFNLFLQITWPLTGIIGTLLVAFKKKEGWLFYVYSNTAAIIFLLQIETYIPIVQYSVYMVLNVIGIVKWFGGGKTKTAKPFCLRAVRRSYQKSYGRKSKNVQYLETEMILLFKRGIFVWLDWRFPWLHFRRGLRKEIQFK